MNYFESCGYFTVATELVWSAVEEVENESKTGLYVLIKVGAFPNVRRRYGNDFLYDFTFGFKVGDTAYEETSIHNFKIFPKAIAAP